MQKISIMRKLFITILILIPLINFSQQSDSTSTKNLIVGLTFSPDYCYRTLIANKSAQWIVDIRDTSETYKFGFTTGLRFVYKLNRRFAIETGLLFSDKGEKTKKLKLVNLSGEMGVAENNYHYYYIDLPLKFNYTFILKRLKFFISGGVSTNIFLTQKTTSTLEYSDGSTETINSSSNSLLSKVNIVALGGFGIDYNFTNRLNCRIEPTYRRSIIPIADTPIKQYQYSFGANVGLFYNL